MSERQTGRTTKMLMAAAAAQLQGQRVLIIAPNSRILDHLQRMSTDLGLNPSTKVFAVAQQVIDGGWCRGFSGEVFADHTVWEGLSSEEQHVLETEIRLINPSWNSASFEEEDRLRLREELRQMQEEAV